MQRGKYAIRHDMTDLTLFSGGTKTYYVDATIGVDTNDGLSWSRPKKTIMGALTDLEAWTRVFIKPGTYAENVVIDEDHVELVGTVRDGSAAVTIQPAAGVPVTIAAEQCVLQNIGCIGSDDNVIEISGSRHLLKNVYVEAGAAATGGIILSDSDKTVLDDVHADGKYKLNVIGILIDDDTVDAIIKNCYLTGWGSGTGHGSNNGYAIGRKEGAQRITIIDNEIISNYVGVYWYTPTGTDLEGDIVAHNTFIENQSYDCWDTHDYTSSANLIDENFYGYATGSDNWFDDLNGDNIADFVIVCGTSNYDKHPLPSPFAHHVTKGYARRHTI